MKNIAIGTLIFVSGVGVGVLASNRYFRSKYAKISANEIADIREIYRRKIKALNANVNEPNPGNMFESKGEPQPPKPSVPITNEHPHKPELDELAVKYGYKQEGELKAGENDPAPRPLTRLERRQNVDDIPYVISPEEFGEVGYEQIELTYYDDGVLADDGDEIIDDVEAVVGPYALTSFGKYEDDAVFVRNDARRCDYEILADHRNYDDVIRPRGVEV